MTQYEILSLRNELAERLQTSVRMFVSFTFAVFIAGFYFGDRLDGVSTAVLLFIYSLAVVSIQGQSSIATTQMRQLVAEAGILVGKTDEMPPSLNLETLRPPTILVKSTLGMIAITYVAAFLFVLRSAGFIPV